MKDKTALVLSPAVTSLANATIKQLLTPMDEQRLRSTCLQKSGLFFQEVYSYFLTGCASQVYTDSKVNPTLIRPFERKWKVHYRSCPFYGYIPIDRSVGIFIILPKTNNLTVFRSWLLDAKTESKKECQFKKNKKLNVGRKYEWNHARKV